MLHGDFQVQNVLMPIKLKTHQPILFDWEFTMRGVGPTEIAKMLIIGQWEYRFPIDKRRELENLLLRRYHMKLSESGISNYSLEDCLYDYRLSVMTRLAEPLYFKNMKWMESAMCAFKDWNCAELLT